MVGPILKQRHSTARLAWARARHRWRLHTGQHILFSDESRLSLRFSDGRYRVYRRCGERFTDQCVYESDLFGGGRIMVWDGICHDGRTHLTIVQGTLNAVIYRDDILDLISFCPFCNSKTLITSFNMTMPDVTWLVFVKTFLTKITSVFFLSRHYHRICHQINIYGMNSVDVFATVTIHRKCYMNCATHLCTSRTTSHKPLSND